VVRDSWFVELERRFSFDVRILPICFSSVRMHGTVIFVTACDLWEVYYPPHV